MRSERLALQRLPRCHTGLLTVASRWRSFDRLARADVKAIRGWAYRSVGQRPAVGRSPILYRDLLGYLSICYKAERTRDRAGRPERRSTTVARRILRRSRASRIICWEYVTIGTIGHSRKRAHLLSTNNFFLSLGKKCVTKINNPVLSTKRNFYDYSCFRIRHWRNLNTLEARNNIGVWIFKQL